jgi:hypothetical protein
METRISSVFFFTVKKKTELRLTHASDPGTHIYTGQQHAEQASAAGIDQKGKQARNNAVSNMYILCRLCMQKT